MTNMLLSLMGRIQAARITAEDEGQALVEYGILVGLIAVACIVAVTLLGTQIAAFFDQITTALGG